MESKTRNTLGMTRGSWSLVRIGALLVTAGLLTLAGCATSPYGQRVKYQTCSDERLALAFALYGKARDELALHYRQRMDSALENAYQASVDSMLVARTVRNCDDFNTLIKRDALNLIRVNRLFQILVTSNMRDQDPGVVVGFFGEDYRDVFPNDIR
ncbi:MAG: hypothetical protein OEW39_06210 [Deltaproteobacteria bacterium]|nr:hypothetical protein [Deltaproteobacteria bacterium]